MKMASKVCSRNRIDSHKHYRLRKRMRALSTSWTNVQARKLVLMVEAEEQLWNSFHKDYRNFKASRIVWDKIGEQMERTTEDCVNKWASLRSNFKARHLNKKNEEEGGGEAATPEDMPVPYSHMGFLVPVIKKKQSLRKRRSAKKTTNFSSVFVMNDEVLAEGSIELVDPISDNSNWPQTSSFQKETMLAIAFENLLNPKDEWEKVAQVIAEHMRNAVNELPHLADKFRVKLLQVALDVQKARVNARVEAANERDVKIDINN